MTSPRVLVVEDHRPLRDLLTSTLRECGYDVGEAGSCAALRKAVREVPGGGEAQVRLVIVDTTLPDGSGIAAVAGIRSEGWNGPVIFVAPFACEAQRQARCVPDSLLLVRPFDALQLRTWATALVPVRSGRDPTRRP